MKKLLCLMVSVIMLLSFTACGSQGDGKGDSVDVTISFGAQSYTVGIDKYNMVSDDITVAPAETKLVYKIADESIASISKKGEVYGVKSGTTTLTASTEDGKASATCNINVIGIGSIVSKEENSASGGIINKYYMATERPADDAATIVIVPANLSKDADLIGIETLDYGELKEDESAVKVYDDGYIIAKTNTSGHFEIEDVPAGDYVVLIFSSYQYYYDKSYTKEGSVASIKNSKMGQFLSEDIISKILDKIDTKGVELYRREHVVLDLKVEANKAAVLTHCFRIDDYQ